jgi:hypothetical protein
MRFQKNGLREGKVSLRFDKLHRPFCVRSGRIFGTLPQGYPLMEEQEKAMITFALAQELRNAGFTPSKNSNAVYFINDHLKIRREDALRMWYGAVLSGSARVSL